MQTHSKGNNDATRALRELSARQSAALAAGALLMVLGVGGAVFGAMISTTVTKTATIIFALGAAVFTAMQIKQTYSGTDITLRRLRQIMLITDAAFIIAALLMIESNFQIIFPYVARTIDGYNAWVHYVYNNWVVALLIAAILEMYATHRISYEMKKRKTE